jgi:hypothetical protein
MLALTLPIPSGSYQKGDVQARYWIVFGMAASQHSAKSAATAAGLLQSTWASLQMRDNADGDRVGGRRVVAPARV